MPLHDTPVTIAASFEHGGLHEQRTLHWVPLDLSEPHTLHVRQGDTLKFSVPASPGTTVTLFSPSSQSLTNQTETSAIPLTSQIGKYQFSQTGPHTLSWHDHSGLRTQTIIHVHPRTFSADSSSAIKNRVCQIQPSHDTSGLTPDGGDAILLNQRLPLAHGEKLALAMRQSGTLHLGFREPSSGRLIGLWPMHVADFSDALGSMDFGSFTTPTQDTKGTISRMAFDALPEDWTIEVSIFRAGVTFRDGSIQHTYRSSDLINGILSLELIRPANQSGGLCHRFALRDASGQLVK